MLVILNCTACFQSLSTLCNFSFGLQLGMKSIKNTLDKLDATRSPDWDWGEHCFPEGSRRNNCNCIPSIALNRHGISPSYKYELACCKLQTQVCKQNLVDENTTKQHFSDTQFLYSIFRQSTIFNIPPIFHLKNTTGT